MRRGLTRLLQLPLSLAVLVWLAFHWTATP